MDFLRKLLGSYNPKIKLEMLLIERLGFQLPDVTIIAREINRLEQQNSLTSSGAEQIVESREEGLRSLIDLRQRFDEAQKEEEDVRAQAALELGKMRVKNAITPLIAALEDTYASVRANAATALGSIGDRIALDQLSKCSREDKDASVRQMAQEALEAIQAQSFDYALMLEKRGKWAEVIEVNKAILDIDPGFQKSYHCIILTYAGLSDFESAKEWSEKALEKVPDDPQARYFLGLSLREQGNYDDALRQLKQAQDDWMRLIKNEPVKLKKIGIRIPGEPETMHEEARGYRTLANDIEEQMAQIEQITAKKRGIPPHRQ